MQRCCNNQYLLSAGNWTSQNHVSSVHSEPSWWTQKSVFGARMISAVTLPDRKCLLVVIFVYRRSSVQAKGQRAGRCWQKNSESPITLIHAGAAWHPTVFPSGDDGLMCASPFFLEDLPVFQQLKMTGEGKMRLCVRFLCVCVGFCKLLTIWNVLLVCFIVLLAIW